MLKNTYIDDDRKRFEHEMNPDDSIIPRWYDWLLYKLFMWRWNRILRNNDPIRRLFIKSMDDWEKTFDSRAAQKRFDASLEHQKRRAEKVRKK